jgi:isoquinoline 1-oxidoreductase subunit alpha
MEIKIHVNGENRTVNVPPETPLLWVLREELSLTGTKFGCGIAQCGACIVHLNGAATRSCVMPVSAASTAAGIKITTIEGLSKDGSHPLQKAWIEKQVPQCGYCQSGMLMAAAALLIANPKPTAQQIAQTMTNMCRCGTYPRVKSAILSIARK